jgi:hypothetical protein
LYKDLGVDYTAPPVTGEKYDLKIFNAKCKVKVGNQVPIERTL